MSRYDEAKAQYAAIGVDVEKALQTLQNVRISMHCWQGDDVLGYLLLNPWQAQAQPARLLHDHQ